MLRPKIYFCKVKKKVKIITSEFSSLRGARSPLHEAVEVVVDQSVAGQNLVDVDGVVLFSVLGDFVGGGGLGGGRQQCHDDEGAEVHLGAGVWIGEECNECIGAVSYLYPEIDRAASMRAPETSTVNQ